jgi:hypothetical protein
MKKSFALYWAVHKKLDHYFNAVTFYKSKINSLLSNLQTVFKIVWLLNKIKTQTYKLKLSDQFIAIFILYLCYVHGFILGSRALEERLLVYGYMLF